MPSGLVGAARLATQRAAGRQSGVAVTFADHVDHQLTRRATLPKPIDAVWLPSSIVSNSHDGRSPPGADSTTRSSVPARKVWTIGSIGILTSVYWVV